MRGKGSKPLPAPNMSLVDALQRLEMRLNFNRMDLGEPNDITPRALSHLVRQPQSKPTVRVSSGCTKRGRVVPIKADDDERDYGSEINVIADISSACTDLFRACEDGDYAHAVELVLDDEERNGGSGSFLVHQSNEYGNNAVMHAAWGLSNDPALISFLIDKGSDPACLNLEGSTPLHEACIAGKLDVVKRLLEEDSDRELCLNRPDLLRRRRTPLLLAAAYGRIECVEELLHAGANVNDEGAHGIDYDQAKCTPLQIACRYKQLPCVAALLRANAPFVIVQKHWPEALQFPEIESSTRWQRRRAYVTAVYPRGASHHHHPILHGGDLSKEIAFWL